MINKFADFLAEKTRNNPATIHLDLLGLIRLGKDNNERLEVFSKLLVDIENKGGNICLPAYSLSYTKNENYNILQTPSTEVGIVSEYIRKSFPERRTADALFSYTVLGNEISGKHFEARNYESFGGESLIEEVFKKDGYICSIGRVFRNCTEIHFIENLLEVKYRFNKNFYGTITDRENNNYKQQITYFCKNFDYNLWYDFKNLEDNLKQDGLMEILRVEGFPIFIEAIKFKTLYDYIEMKIRKDYFYFIKDLKDKRI